MAIFLDKLESNRPEKKRSTEEIRRWLINKLGVFRSINPRYVMRDNPEYLKTTIRPGYMYMYAYDPKYKDTLPFYDRIPLVFPFKAVKGGFIGINLHYLNPILSAKLMDSLYKEISDTRYDENTRLRITYAKLSALAGTKLFEPCIKRYLYSHMQTKFLLIPANEWDYALFMPFERFETKGGRINKNVVFKDSLGKIYGV
jgi:hypothetical protein